MTNTDVLKLQVMWNRLIAAAEEQAQVLIRSSFSTTVREAGDLSAGVFDLKGRMLAQAVTGTPGHVNSMANALPHFLEIYPPEKMSPGDSYITNDPWQTAGHLHDVTVVTPAFYKERVVGFFAACIHVVDIGGRGLGTDGRQVFEEGLSIPIMALARAGQINDDLIRIIRANSREPDQVQGDLFSCAAAGEEGGRRLAKMMEEFGIEDLDDLGDHIIDHSRRATLAAIAKLPNRDYSYSMTTDGYDAPITVCAKLTASASGIHVDYTGTSPMSAYGINVVLAYTLAYTIFGVRCVIGAEIPNNSGSMSAITVSAPEGCILNARRPAPVSARHIVGHMLPDVIIGCLNDAFPGGTLAEGSMRWNPMLRGNTWFDGTPRAWELYTFGSGGMGARSTKDGLSTTAFPSGVHIIPTEVVEVTSPVMIWRKEYRPDSGGAGQYRGGLGQVVELASAVDAPLYIQAMFDRVENPARGRNGAGSGGAGVITTSLNRPFRSKGLQKIDAGERLRLELPGGGGFGDPALRDENKVANDVLDGYVSREMAEKLYKVRVDDDGKPAHIK